MSRIRDFFKNNPKKIVKVVKNKVKKSPREKHRKKNKTSGEKENEEDGGGNDDNPDDWIEKSKKFWQDFYNRNLTDEEIEEIQKNLNNFILLIIIKELERFEEIKMEELMWEPKTIIKRRKKSI
ncbi:MAG: hypothetical protein ACP5OB_08460 [Candidatus Ratteibacteria bacterium]